MTRTRYHDLLPPNATTGFPIFSATRPEPRLLEVLNRRHVRRQANLEETRIHSEAAAVSEENTQIKSASDGPGPTQVQVERLNRLRLARAQCPNRVERLNRLARVTVPLATDG
jgi:hypothetical protein